MDIEQLNKIQELKKQLGEKGGLYWMFDSTEDFESLLRGHLSKIAQKWSSTTNDISIHESKSTSVAILADEYSKSEFIGDIDEYGLLDYMEIYEDRIFDMTSALSSISDATERVGGQFNKRTEEINSLTIEQQSNSLQARKFIKSSSDDMERYAEIIDLQIKIMSKSREEAFDALSKAVSIYVDFNSVNTDRTADLSISLDGLIESTSVANKGVFELREVISNLPRLTIQLNKSKRKVVKSLDDILDEIRNTIQSAINVQKIINEFKHNKSYSKL